MSTNLRYMITKFAEEDPIAATNQWILERRRAQVDKPPAPPKPRSNRAKGVA